MRQLPQAPRVLHEGRHEGEATSRHAGGRGQLPFVII